MQNERIFQITKEKKKKQNQKAWIFTGHVTTI